MNERDTQIEAVVAVTWGAPEGPSVDSRIAAARIAAGLTQEQLALACSVSRSAVAQWETNRAFPSTGRLNLLARVLGIPVTDLL